MADNDKVVEPVVEEQGTEPEVELDKPTDIKGELVENPTIEEVEDDSTADESSDRGTDKDASVVSPDNADDNSDVDSSVDVSTSDADTGPEKSEEIEPEKDEEGVYSTPTATDPGEFQPKGDYSFEVTTADGQTIKIDTPEQADALAKRLDTEENLLTAYQFTQFQRNFLRMDSGIDREKVQYEQDKEVFERQQAQEQVKTEQITKWSNELRYLENKGALPKIGEGIDVPGGWEKNPTDPGVKARMDIFNWMQKENQERKVAGIDEITSTVDAHRLMQADIQEQQADEERGREGNTRRAKGKMVSGNAPYTPPVEQSGRIIGEGGSLNDLVREYST